MASGIRKSGRKEPRTRTVSSNDAKQQWGTMLKAVEDGEDVIVASYGKARAVVISPEAYEELRQARERQHREDAMRLLREIESSYDGRNSDLAEDEIEAIAVREGREINRAVAEQLCRRSTGSE